MSKRKEGKVERYLVNEVESIGGKCFKMTSLSVNGWPDRLVIVPHRGQGASHIAFIETKTSKEVQKDGQPGRLRPSQVVLHRELAELNVTVLVIDEKEFVDDYISFVLQNGFGHRRVVLPVKE